MTDKAVPRMKAKTKAFADKLLADPKTSATQAYLDTHITESRSNAKTQASKLLSKPNVRVYMDKVETDAKLKIAELVHSDKQDIALKASQDILDRNTGKATQKTESLSVNANLNVEANKSISDAFTAFLSGSTTQT